MIGRCPLCPGKDQLLNAKNEVLQAKDQHITFLESQVKDLLARNMELTVPGSSIRATYTQPPAREKRDTVPVSHSPRRLAQMRRDEPTNSKDPTIVAMSARDVEKSFEAKG